MDDVGKMLVSPVFWVGTVVVGLFVNFASQWLYGRLAKLPGRLGEWRRARSARASQKFDRQVSELVAVPSLVPFYVATEMRHRSRAICWLVLVCIEILIYALARTPGVYEPLVANLRHVVQGAVSALILFSFGFGTLEIARASEVAAVLREAEYITEPL